MEKDLIASAWDKLTEYVRENDRERKSRQLNYHQELLEDFNFSPQEFYLRLGHNLEKRRVPGLHPELTHINETIRGSAKRLYLIISRERFMYYVCAAPFGSGFFVSWRLVDERRPATWVHFVAVYFLLGFFGLAVANFFGIVVAWISTGLLVTGLWSMMRIASLTGFEGVATTIENTPIVGRIFELFYRPDTYYRQDTLKMFQKAFENAIKESIASVTSLQGTRNNMHRDTAPVVADLHRQ